MELLEERARHALFACTAGLPRLALGRQRRPRAARQGGHGLRDQPGPGRGRPARPEWLPYADRLAPGDLGAGDVLPYSEDDPNLESGFEATGDEDVDQMASSSSASAARACCPPRVARPRPSAGTTARTARHAEVAEKAPAPCSTCGFFVPMAGALRAFFGVCANAWSPSDGRVVSLDHGCGAHSEVDVVLEEPRPADEPALDEYAVDSLV